jgi:hypothetical protein
MRGRRRRQRCACPALQRVSRADGARHGNSDPPSHRNAGADLFIIARNFVYRRQPDEVHDVDGWNIHHDRGRRVHGERHIRIERRNGFVQLDDGVGDVCAD